MLDRTSAIVAQVSNLPYRRFPIGRAFVASRHASEFRVYAALAPTPDVRKGLFSSCTHNNPHSSSAHAVKQSQTWRSGRDVAPRRPPHFAILILNFSFFISTQTTRTRGLRLRPPLAYANVPVARKSTSALAAADLVMPVDDGCQSSSGVEQRTHKPLVGGSNPSSGTTSKNPIESMVSCVVYLPKSDPKNN